MAWPRIVPHSDGAGVIEAVGADVDRARIGERVWIWNGQWQRPFGTAAELIVLPAAAGGEAAGRHQLRPGRLSRHPGDDGLVRALRGRSGRRADGPRDRGAGTVGRYACQMARLGGAR